ncbi:MAG: hypothetical protein GY929_13455 [Actinomycetia bacterium]|nr:hypothetical protein [Actinomycetes bacterium]
MTTGNTSNPNRVPPTMPTRTTHSPLSVASELVGADYDARVLEPSPPTVSSEPFFADDPVSASDNRRPGTRLVVPAGMPGHLSWDAWLVDHPEHADWVASRFLGGTRRLPETPKDLGTTRESLHRLAAYVIAPARHRANGKFGLRWTHGGFGTPFFGDDRQVRVEGIQLVDQQGPTTRVAPITSLRAAAEFLRSDIDTETAAEHDSPAVGDPDEPLAIDEQAAQFLGAWYGMAFAALELLRSDDASVDPSRPQLWPGHFDPAIEVGDDDHRASYGASPGDGGIDEPYLYASIWWPDRISIDTGDPAWNAPSFTGAVLRRSDFPTDADPVVVAASFWRSARNRLG